MLKAVENAAERAGETRSAFAQGDLRKSKPSSNAALEANYQASHLETPDGDAWLLMTRAWG